MPNVSATILKSAICKTNSFPRPCPGLFYFPGLNSSPVYSTEIFENITTVLRQNYKDILDEYNSNLILSATHNDSDYKIRNDEHQLHTGSWDWKSFLLKGEKQSNFITNYPITSAILDSIPNLMTNIPFGYAFFSSIKPFSSIALHSGPCNLRIRCHFPLIVPDSPIETLGMSVGGQLVRWTPGVPIYFDDCYEHEVWNKTDQTRVVLLFDMWHPDLTEEEKKAIIEMFGFAKDQGWLKKS